MYLTFALGVIAFLFSLLLTPVIRDIFRRVGIVDHPDAIRKHHSGPIPRVGGIAIAVSYVAAFTIALYLPFSYVSTLEKAIPVVWKMFPAFLTIFLVGLADDLFGLRPWQKLLGQTLAALMAYLAGVHFEWIGRGTEWGQYIGLPLTMLWLVGCSNAFNLIDGMDGLATGVGLFASLTVLIAALTQNNVALALATMPLVGCLLGFLRYNFNPASVFLGDSGSLTIGFLLGCFGVLWSQKSATLLGLTAPLMAVSIPLLDVALSIARRFIRHQPIFGADRGHIHHRLLDRGLTPRKAALLMYGISGLVAGLSLLQSSLQNHVGGLIVVLFCVSAWIGVQHLGYVEFGVARQMFFKGNFRRIIDSQTRLKNFQEQLGRAGTIDDCWNVILRGCTDFGFDGARMNIQGRLFEKRSVEAAEMQFQLRVPLADGQYVNFQRKFETETNLVTVAGFVRAVKETLQGRLVESELMFPKPVQRVQYIAPPRRDLASSAQAGVE